MDIESEIKDIKEMIQDIQETLSFQEDRYVGWIYDLQNHKELLISFVEYNKETAAILRSMNQTTKEIIATFNDMVYSLIESYNGGISKRYIKKVGPNQYN